jgi:hypothetical protein
MKISCGRALPRPLARPGRQASGKLHDERAGTFIKRVDDGLEGRWWVVREARMLRARTQEAHTGAPAASARPAARSPLSALWSAVVGAVGVVVGLAPHVLHHVGFLVGTALVAGAGGTVLFGLLGLAASLPLLWRLRRRFDSWWAPGIALAVFVAMFSLSTFVIGPRITGGADVGSPSSPPATQPAAGSGGEHASHHKP